MADTIYFLQLLIFDVPFDAQTYTFEKALISNSRVNELINKRGASCSCSLLWNYETVCHKANFSSPSR